VYTLGLHCRQVQARAEKRMAGARGREAIVRRLKEEGPVQDVSLKSGVWFGQKLVNKTGFRNCSLKRRGGGEYVPRKVKSE